MGTRITEKCVREGWPLAESYPGNKGLVPPRSLKVEILSKPSR